MIGKTVYENGRVYVCDDCKKNVAHFKSHKAAISASWAVSRDYTNCYCPECAPAHRKGAAIKVERLPSGWIQLSINSR